MPQYRTAPGGSIGARDALSSYLNGQQKPAPANPQMAKPTSDPRSSLATYMTGGGAAVRGGVNGNGMGVRPPNVMRPTSAYR